QRAPDQGRSALPRSVAGARGGAAGAEGRPRQQRRAAAAAAARAHGADAVHGNAAPRALGRGLPKPMDPSESRSEGTAELAKTAEWRWDRKPRALRVLCGLRGSF